MKMVTKNLVFNCAHRIMRTKSIERNLHGHTWQLKILLQKPKNNEKLDKLLKGFKEELDHSLFLYEKDRHLLEMAAVLDFRTIELPFQTTKIKIAEWIIIELRNKGLKIREIQLNECEQENIEVE